MTQQLSRPWLEGAGTCTVCHTKTERSGLSETMTSIPCPDPQCKGRIRPTDAALYERLARLPCLECEGHGKLLVANEADGFDPEPHGPCGGTGLALPGLSNLCWDCAHGITTMPPLHLEGSECPGRFPFMHDRLERLLEAMEAAGWVMSYDPFDNYGWVFEVRVETLDGEQGILLQGKDPSPYRAAALALLADQEARDGQPHGG